MAVVSMKQLLEAGVHFGHQTRRWNPKMKKYIFGERNGIYIIDLQKTMKKLKEAYRYAREIAENGGVVLFVGTKKQCMESIHDEAIRCGMPYVHNRWLGGMMTNFKTIQKSVVRLKHLEKMSETGILSQLPKKEAAGLEKEREKMSRVLAGVKDLSRLPDALFIIDVRKEANAVHEANLLNIPIIGVVDTNSDPENIDCVIPANDDAIRAGRLLASIIANAVIDGKASELEGKEASSEAVVVETPVKEAPVAEAERPVAKEEPAKEAAPSAKEKTAEEAPKVEKTEEEKPKKTKKEEKAVEEAAAEKKETKKSPAKEKKTTAKTKTTSTKAKKTPAKEKEKTPEEDKEAVAAAGSESVKDSA